MEHSVAAEKLFLMNSLPEEGVEDMARLNYLHEPALLNNLRHRFARDHVYTYTAKICSAVNPFNWAVSKPLYAESLLVKCEEEARTLEDAAAATAIPPPPALHRPPLLRRHLSSSSSACPALSSAAPCPWL